MEIKFCPQCGTGRQGAFCGGCGFHFESFRPTASAEGIRSNEESDHGTGILELTKEPEVSRPSFPIPFGMAYGEYFDQSRDCWNCGVEYGSEECELCGFSKP
jgi:hypothetical protein